MDVLVRDLPDDVHAELSRRAAEHNMSLRAYVADLLAAHVAVPSVHEWLERVRGLGPAFDDEQRGADLVAEARRDDDALIGR